MHIWNDDFHEMSLLHYQMTTNSAVNRYLAYVINNYNKSSY